MYRLATKCTTKNEVRNAITVYRTQAWSRKGTACLSTMTRCREQSHSATAGAAEVCGLRMQIRSNCWIHGLTVNGFFYSEVEMLRSQWIALKYCVQYDRLSQQ